MGGLGCVIFVWSLGLTVLRQILCYWQKQPANPAIAIMRQMNLFAS
jgi:hypothetical protein